MNKFLPCNDKCPMNYHEEVFGNDARMVRGYTSIVSAFRYGFRYRITFYALLLVACYLLLVTPIYAQNSEEAAQDNINIKTRPGGIKIVKAEDPGFLQGVANIFSGLAATFNTLFFNPADLFKDKTGFYNDSQINNSSLIPDQLVPKDDQPLTNLSHSLGHKGSPQVGFYTLGMPNFENQEKAEVKDFECAYEKANFPEGIHPITGQSTRCVTK
jgi:hypothetical protein